MEQIDNKNKATLTILWILTFLIALVGATFGYFNSISKSDEQIITTGQALSVSVVINGSSNVTNISPTTWNANDISENEKNKNISIIPFSVSSTSRVNGSYTINMSTNIIENELFEGGSASDIAYKLYKGNNLVTEGNFNSGDFSKDITTGTITNTNDLNDNYKLYVYIDETHFEQNKLQNISFKITIGGTATQTN